MGDFKVITSDFVNVFISTSKDDIPSFNEKRFQKDISVSDLKEKLELLTGASCSTMSIEVYDKNDKLVCPLSDNAALLGSFPIDNGMRLHVIDKFTLCSSELDGGNVEKYEIPDEKYEQMSDTARSFLMKNKLGQYNEEAQKKKEKQEAEDKKIAEATEVGSRCKVTVMNAPTRLGSVMYTGQVEGLAGYWIGVKYDEPLGKNDGSFKGKKYFDCQQNYGAFIKPKNVMIGDFPEEDYDLNEEI